MQIRHATVADAQAIARLGIITYTDTFGHTYSPEDLHAFLESAYSVEYFIEVLSNPRQNIFVADDNGLLIGYAQMGPCALPHAEASLSQGELKRMYVLKSHHNRGLGKQLLELSLEWLEQHFPGPLWIGVWSENFGAQRLYARYGFHKVGEYGFKVGKAVDLEWILRRPGGPAV